MFRALVALAAVLGLLAPTRAAAQPVTQLKTLGTSDQITAASDTVTLSDTGGMSTLLIQTTGTFSLTWELQCAGDGTTFDADDEIPVTLVSSSPSPADAITSNAAALYTANIGGCRAVRVIATAYTSGTLTATLTAIPVGGGSAGAATAGAVTNTGTFAVQEDGAVLTALQTLDNAISGSGINISQIGGVAPVSAICDDPAKVTFIDVNEGAATGNVQELALDGADLIYVCSFSLIVGGASTVQIIHGTGSACATGETDVATFNFAAAGDGIALSGGGSPLFVIPSGGALCHERGSSVTLSGFFAVVQQP